MKLHWFAARRESGRALTISRKPVVRLFAGLVILVLMAASFGWARDGKRRISGTVLDQSGAPIPRVLIEIRPASGSSTLVALTDNQGNFSLELLDGKYVLDASIAGLAPIRQQPLEVGITPTPLRITLEIPAIHQSIVVTATRTESPLAQVGSSTTVIRGDELEQQGVASFPDALRRVAGLNVAQSGGSGQLASLFLRGGESDYTKVLIDGIPANDPGGSFNFSNLSLASIDRIEIVRGPQSALFGSDAMAGVIQVFTRRGSSEGLEPRPSVAIEGGSFSTLRTQAGIGGKNERFDYAASFSRLDTDNRIRNGSFNDETVTGNFGFRPSRKSELRAVFRSDAGRAGVPGQWAFHRPDPDMYYRHRAIAGGLTLTHFASSSWTQTLSYTVNDSRQFSENPIDSGPFRSQYGGKTAPFLSYDFTFQTLNESRRQKIAYQSEWSLPRAHLLTAGAEYERESGTVGDPSFDPLLAVRKNIGAFVQDQWFLHKRFFAAAGVRLEHNENFGFSTAPRVSLAWHARQPAPNKRLGLTKLKANFGLGIKEPTLVESFSKSPFFLGNPNLKPEKSVSFDAGIEQSYNNGKGIFEVAYFENRYRNQIDFLTTDYTTFAGTFFNLGKSRARGMETSFRQEIGRRWGISGTYTFLSSQVLESAAFDPVFAPGQALLRRPRHSGSLDLKWRPGRWILGATGTFVGRRVDSDFSGLGLISNPGFGVLDLLVSFRLFTGASLFLVVNNALDKNYMEVLGYPALPARFRIGFTTGF